MRWQFHFYYDYYLLLKNPIYFKNLLITKPKYLLKGVESQRSMNRRGFLKLGLSALAIGALGKPVSHITPIIGSNRKLFSATEKEILNHYQEYKNEIDFWIHDYFKLPDGRAIYFKKNKLKKMEFKLESEFSRNGKKDYVHLKGVRDDPNTIVIHPISDEDIFLSTEASLHPSEWQSSFPDYKTVRKEFKNIFEEQGIRGMWYLRGRNSRVIQALEAAPKYHYWLKDQLAPNNATRFPVIEIPEEFFFLALSESQLNPRAVSSRKARGHLQLMWSTARRYGLELTRYVDERRDIFKATHASWAYLSDLFNVLDDWRLVLTGYNVGEYNIFNALEESMGLKENYNAYYERRYWAKNPNIKSFFEYHNIENPDFKNIYKELYRYFMEENWFDAAQFVNMFVTYYLVSNNPEKFGFYNLNHQQPVDFQEVKLEQKALLEDIIESLAPQGSEETMHELNAHYTLVREIPSNLEIRVPIINR